MPESHVKTRARPSKTSLLLTGVDVTASHHDRTGGAPQEGPKGCPAHIRDPLRHHHHHHPPLHRLPCLSPCPALTATAAPTPPRGAHPSPPCWGGGGWRRWSSPSPGAAPHTAATPHSSLTMGPRGTSYRASLGLPRTLASAASRTAPVPRNPPHDAPSTHPPPPKQK